MKSEKALLLKINGELQDLSTPTTATDHVEEICVDSPEALPVFRHSAAHLLAQAVLELYPGVQYGIGPAVDDGFYYDFLTPTPFTPEDLAAIEKKMAHLAKSNLKVEHLHWSKDEALRYFQEHGQHLKVELINEKVEGDRVSVYRQGKFVDLCRGPHLPSTLPLRHFKLLYLAAAYWKGDERSHSMQRIYGTVFPTAEALDAHLRFLKEAQERDHRKIGRDLDLFSIQNDVGAGLILWHPAGSMIRHEIESFWKEEHLKNGYELIYSPHIANLELWNTSGHNDFYRENMFTPIEFDNMRYQLKPMNCPFHIVIYKTRNRSYKELPLRWAELGTVYRYERSGVLHGLMRVRGFTQDDAHLFCTPEQLEAEVMELLRFTTHMLTTFGFHDFDIFLSTRPTNSIGEDADWERATAALEKALQTAGLNYSVDPGEGVFYGPKIDIKIKDVLKRSWQCTTIQIDFNLPRRFNLRYVDHEGQLRQPIMIHRALLGSLERFFGVLVEHYGGFFPLWLAPLQIMVVPITENHHEYAGKVAAEMRRRGLRVDVDYRSEGMNRKIRDAEVRKVPFIVVVGEREQQEGKVSFRIHRKGDQGSLPLPELLEKIQKTIEDRQPTYEI